MISEKFVLLAALLNLIGSTSYVVATIRGKTKPNRITFFLWAVAPLIAFSAELGEGVGLPALMTFMVGFGPLMVFIASFVNRKAYWKITKLDWVFGGLSLLGLSLWAITRNGNLAILFSITADGLAAAPTVIKSYKFPDTENHLIYTLGAISAAITMLTIKDWSFAHYGFPAYILLVTSLISFLIISKIGRKPAGIAT